MGGGKGLMLLPETGNIGPAVGPWWQEEGGIQEWWDLSETQSV